MLTLCEKWGKSPPEILELPAWVIRMIRVAEAGGYFDRHEVEQDWGE